jgi:tRNA nucleotidyltransferase (CCA-adding enzyme)
MLSEQDILERIPAYVHSINTTFSSKGYQLFLVGGSVRDLLLEKDVKDWDFTTNATPDQMMALYPDAFYDNAFGTVGIPLKNEQGETEHVIEVTTFRTEREYSDNRHPTSVAWGETIEEDLLRRDFTINAIALRIPASTQDNSMNIDVIDPYHGREDINRRLIRAVGDPAKRFKEDALRLMRAIRLATQLGFSIEDATLKEIQNDAALLNNISKERIRDELLKTLGSEYPYDGVMLLKNTNLLEHILPELLEGIGISQERPGRHHTTDVFTHNVMSLKLTPATDPVVRFATLIHDIAKPRVVGMDHAGYVIFHNHEIVGARMAYEICERLRFSKKQRDKVVTLVRWHMFTVDENTTDASIRRFIRRVGVENIPDMIDLRIGDRLGSGTATAESWRLKLFKKRIEEQLAPAPFSVNDLAVDGTDVMQTLGIKPSKQVGVILNQLFVEVDEDLSKNTKEYLISRIKELAQA